MLDAQHIYDGRVMAAYVQACAYLQRGQGGLDRVVFEAEWQFASAVIASQFPCIGDPKALLAPDTIFFDRAVMLVVAARLFPVVTQGGAGGTVLSTGTADGTKETYAPLDASSPERWVKEAAEAAERIGCVSASLAAAASTYQTSMLAPAHRQGGYSLLAGYPAFFNSFLDYELYPIGFNPALSQTFVALEYSGQ